MSMTTDNGCPPPPLPTTMESQQQKSVDFQQQKSTMPISTVPKMLKGMKTGKVHFLLSFAVALVLVVFVVLVLWFKLGGGFDVDQQQQQPILLFSSKRNDTINVLPTDNESGDVDEDHRYLHQLSFVTPSSPVEAVQTHQQSRTSPFMAQPTNTTSKAPRKEMSLHLHNKAMELSKACKMPEQYETTKDCVRRFKSYSILRLETFSVQNDSLLCFKSL